MPVVSVDIACIHIGRGVCMLVSALARETMWTDRRQHMAMRLTRFFFLVKTCFFLGHVQFVCVAISPSAPPWQDTCRCTGSGTCGALRFGVLDLGTRSAGSRTCDCCGGLFAEPVALCGVRRVGHTHHELDSHKAPLGHVLLCIRHMVGEDSLPRVQFAEGPDKARRTDCYFTRS